MPAGWGGQGRGELQMEEVELEMEDDDDDAAPLTELREEMRGVARGTRHDAARCDGRLTTMPLRPVGRQVAV